MPSKNQPPVAVLSGPSTVVVGESVAFDGSASFDPNPSGIKQWALRSSDGAELASGQHHPPASIPVVFDTAGAVLVQLEVRDSRRLVGISPSHAVTVLDDAVPPPPDPVDCVLGDEEIVSATPTEICQPDGTQETTVEWIRPILTPPANGGAPCGPTGGTRTERRACVYVPPPSPGDHPYFDGLVARPSHYKSYHLRSQEQLAQYSASSSKPQGVNYDSLYDAGEIRIPTWSQTQRSSQLNVLASDIGATDTHLVPSVWASYPVNRQIKLDNEILKVVVADPDDTVPRGITVTRGHYGTTPAPHAAGTPFLLPTNSLSNQVFLPIGTEDGHSYFFIWDELLGQSWMHTGLGGNKAYNLCTPGVGIWLEKKWNFQGGRYAIDPTFSTDIHVGCVDLRAYNRVGGDADWALTDGNSIGPGITRNTPVEPREGTFAAFPERWIRHFVRIEQRANDYDLMTSWIADRDRLVRLYSDVPLSVRPQTNSIDIFRVEYNDSASRHPDERIYNERDLLAYVRNFVVLRDEPDVVSVLVKPL